MMSQFEFIFSLYSLLLGLSLVELLSGLGKTVKARLHVDEETKAGYRIGWLTPLLGLFVMLDLLSFWGAAWAVRDIIAVSGGWMMGTMLFASAYYLAAHLVFPESIPKNGDLDPHYFHVRRIVLGMLFALLFVQLTFYLSHPDLSERLVNPLALGLTAVLIALMTAAFFVKSKTMNIAVLIALIVRYAAVYLI
ncbi:MAG TPA: hypothetical protein PKC48_01740 [Sphingorhabdus sp.]|jgi:hypothetical protein|uniref:hypothetical protein n=1 Tax=Sphingorhabdus sp. TaxID=1902408 RepID=UPI002C31CF9F|nr:hypothetical protein [Sphingorhabdus sp.]HMT40173.1 hypothetical protein [Sphingorhabdus sp.]HMU20975.1 hypothetical protein [Sphingorhabdus sp.]